MTTSWQIEDEFVNIIGPRILKYSLSIWEKSINELVKDGCWRRVTDIKTQNLWCFYLVEMYNPLPSLTEIKFQKKQRPFYRTNWTHLRVIVWEWLNSLGRNFIHIEWTLSDLKCLILCWEQWKWDFKIINNFELYFKWKYKTNVNNKVQK